MWTSVELRQVRTFLVLADELHFGRTAAHLGVTSSSVSQSIHALEALVGGRLFERTSRRVRLTALGEQLRQEMAPAYAALEGAFTAGREMATGVAGVLRIGMYSRASGGPHLYDLINAFHEHHPACRVELVDTGFNRDQLDWLHAGDVDALVSRLPLERPELCIGPVLSREPRVALVAAGHPLAERASVVYEELADYTLTRGPLPQEMMRAFVPGTTPSGRVVTTVPVRSIEEAVMRASVGEVVHATVASIVDYYPHPNVVAVPIDDLPLSETALVWRRANTTARLRAFVAVADHVLASI